MRKTHEGERHKWWERNKKHHYRDHEQKQTCKKKKGIINIKFAYPIKNSNNDVTFSFSVTLDTRMCVSAHML